MDSYTQAKKDLRKMAHELDNLPPSRVGRHIGQMSGIADHYGIQLDRYIDIDDYRQLLIGEGRWHE